MLICRLKNFIRKKKIKDLYFKKHIKLVDKVKINLVKINKINFVLLSFQDYIYKFLKIPFLVKLEISSNFLTLEGFNALYDKLFFKYFNVFSIDFNKPFYRKLLLKGLGYKISYFSKKNLLEFKLGFSHKKNLFIPKINIKIFIKKNSLLFKCYNLIQLGNFLFLIKNLKKANAYKEKGFSFQNEKKLLKVIKKL